MTVASIFDRQVDNLAEKVNRWHGGKGEDESLEEAIRKQVSGELLNQGKLNVVSAVLEELTSDDAKERLKDVIDSCKQHFYLEDRVLSVVVVPVAVKLRSRTEGGVQLAEARLDDLTSLASVMEAKLEARKVVFDRRLYDGRGIFSRNTKSMLEFCKRLEAGEVLPEGGPKATVLRSSIEDCWEMVYLLGVEVRGLDQELTLEADQSQREMTNWVCHAEWAIAEAESILFNSNVVAEAKCHGFWYAGKGLKEGQDIVRGYQLESLMRNFDQGETGVWFYFSKDEVKNTVRVLITGTPMAVEYRWQLFPGESMDGFKRGLGRVIDMFVPRDDVRAMEEMHLFDYERKARQEGLSW